MAEVLGTVASGIAVAQLAGNLISSIQKLKSFRDQVAQVDSEINHQILQLDVLFRTLDSMQIQSEDSAVPTECFDICKVAADKLSELVKEFSKKLEGKTGLKRKAESARFVLKKDDLERFKKRLYESIQLLQLACNLQTNAMLQKNAAMMEMMQTMVQMQPSIITAEFSKIMAESHTTVSVATNTSVKTSTVACKTLQTTSTWAPYVFGSFYFASGGCSYQGRSRNVRAYYKAPLWYSSKVWDIAGRENSSGWQFSFSTYRVIPNDSPFFEAVHDGDLLEVRRMLTNKDAFISDRDDKYGRTALHYAAMLKYYDMCEFLIAQGASVLALKNDGEAPLHDLVWSTDNPLHAEDTARLLINAGSSEFLIEDYFVLEICDSPNGLFQYLQSQIFPPYQQTAGVDKFKIIVQNLRHTSMECLASNLTLALGNEDKWKDLVRLTDRYGQNLLYYAAESISRFRYKLEHLYLNDPYSSFRVQLRKLVSIGLEVSSISMVEETPLYTLIYYCFQYGGFNKTATQRLSELIHVFLTDLSMAGIDLVQYGAAERKQIAHCSKEFWDYEKRICTGFVGFVYGPQPEDWKFWFLDQDNGFARDFWSMIEDPAGGIFEDFDSDHYRLSDQDDDKAPDEPEMRIPGAWDEGES